MTSRAGGLAAFVAVAVALVAAAHIPAVREHLTVAEITGWVERLGFWAPLAIVGISAVLPFMFLPRWPVVFVAGALYGVLWGSILGSIAGTIGALAHFLLSKPLFHSVGDRVRKRFNLPDHMDDHQTWILLFTLRVFPLSNNSLTNLLAGALGMRVTPFIGATFIGTIPSTLMYAAWGKLLQKPSSAYYALAVALVAVLALGSWWIGKKLLPARNERSDSDEVDLAGG
ncbi:MAG: VTT domain-containing protein [Kiritimatiellia bacterium]